MDQLIIPKIMWTLGWWACLGSFSFWIPFLTAALAAFMNGASMRVLCWIRAARLLSCNGLHKFYLVEPRENGIAGCDKTETWPALTLHLRLPAPLVSVQVAASCPFVQRRRRPLQVWRLPACQASKQLGAASSISTQ